MSNAAALEVLEKRLDDQIRKVNSLLVVINDLRQEDGLTPLAPIGGGNGSGSSNSAKSTSSIPAQIRPDTFYGKRMQTAIREFLEMRKASGAGPATPREIYDAITQGGYQFETRDERVALVGLRALLRKRTAFFHKLPNGNYGLTS